MDGEASVESRVREIAARAAAERGVELVHAEVAGGARSPVVRIFIDKPGGVTINDCERVSNQVGTLFDVEDLIPNQYTLEVSSPGIERGLYKPADYARFSGNRVKLRTMAPINGQRNFKGKLLGIDGDIVSLEADTAGRIDIPFEQIAKANIEYEF